MSSHKKIVISCVALNFLTIIDLVVMCISRKPDKQCVYSLVQAQFTAMLV